MDVETYFPSYFLAELGGWETTSVATSKTTPGLPVLHWRCGFRTGKVKLPNELWLIHPNLHHSYMNTTSHTTIFETVFVTFASLTLQLLPRGADTGFHSLSSDFATCNKLPAVWLGFGLSPPTKAVPKF